MTEESEQFRAAAREMERRGVHPDDYVLYGVKHQLLPPWMAGTLADSYERGCPNCRHKFDD